jgi:hypothetical protein
MDTINIYVIPDAPGKNIAASMASGMAKKRELRDLVFTIESKLLETVEFYAGKKIMLHSDSQLQVRDANLKSALVSNRVQIFAPVYESVRAPEVTFMKPGELLIEDQYEYDDDDGSDTTQSRMSRSRTASPYQVLSDRESSDSYYGPPQSFPNPFTPWVTPSKVENLAAARLSASFENISIGNRVSAARQTPIVKTLPGLGPINHDANFTKISIPSRRSQTISMTPKKGKETRTWLCAEMFSEDFAQYAEEHDIFRLLTVSLANDPQREASVPEKWTDQYQDSHVYRHGVCIDITEKDYDGSKYYFNMPAHGIVHAEGKPQPGVMYYQAFVELRAKAVVAFGICTIPSVTVNARTISRIPPTGKEHPLTLVDASYMNNCYRDIETSFKGFTSENYGVNSHLDFLIDGVKISQNTAYVRANIANAFILAFSNDFKLIPHPTLVNPKIVSARVDHYYETLVSPGALWCGSGWRAANIPHWLHFLAIVDRCEGCTTMLCNHGGYEIREIIEDPAREIPSLVKMLDSGAPNSNLQDDEFFRVGYIPCDATKIWRIGKLLEDQYATSTEGVTAQVLLGRSEFSQKRTDPFDFGLPEVKYIVPVLGGARSDSFEANLCMLFFQTIDISELQMRMKFVFQHYKRNCTRMLSDIENSIRAYNPVNPGQFVEAFAQLRRGAPYVTPLPPPVEDIDDVHACHLFYCEFIEWARTEVQAYFMEAVKNYSPTALDAPFFIYAHLVQAVFPDLKINF